MGSFPGECSQKAAGFLPVHQIVLKSLFQMQVHATALGLQIWLVKMFCFECISIPALLILHVLHTGHFNVVTILLDKAEEAKLLDELLQTVDHVSHFILTASLTFKVAVKTVKVAVKTEQHIFAAYPTENKRT